MLKVVKKYSDKFIKIGIIFFALILLVSFFFFKSGKVSSFLFTALISLFYYFLFYQKKIRFSWSWKVSISHIIIFSFIVRILWVVLNRDFNYHSDWLFYHQNALSVLNGEKLFFDSKANGVSILTSAFYLFFSVGHFGAATLQIILSCLIVFLVYFLGSKIFNTKVGLAAATIAALNPTFIVYCNVINSQLLFTAFFLSCIAIMSKKINLKNIIIVGFLAGFSQYVRLSGNLFLISYLALTLITLNYKKGIVYGFSLIFCFLIVQGPIFYYNYSSFNLISNSPATGQALGWSMLIGANIDENGDYNKKDLDYLYDDLSGRSNNMMPYEIDDHAKKLAFDRVLNNPFKLFLFAVFKKPLLLWSEGADIPGLGSWFKNYELWIIRISHVYHKILLLLCASGLFLYLKLKNKKPIVNYLVIFGVCFTMAHIFLNVTPRYVMPFYPLLILMGAYFLFTNPRVIK